jgi:hypothetical protein
LVVLFWHIEKIYFSVGKSTSISKSLEILLNSRVFSLVANMQGGELIK